MNINDYKTLVIFISIAFPVVCFVFLYLLWQTDTKLSYLEDVRIDSYQETTRIQFDKMREMNAKLSYQQEKHDKMIEVLRLRLDKLIEREKQLTFDSTDPGYHRELLNALTELKDIKDREKKLNEEIEKILQTGDP